MNSSIAFLLSIYSNVEQTNIFLRQILQYQYAEVYIHCDCKLLSSERNMIIQDKRVHIIPESYDVQWGEYSQIKVYNQLFRYAQTGNYDFYSLNSGVDLFTRPIADFVAWLEHNKYYACYNCTPLPKSYWQFRGGLGRVELYWPKMFLRRLTNHHPLRYLRTLYGLLYDTHLIKGKKLPDKFVFYGGNDWFTWSNDCMKDMLTFLDTNPDFDQLFHHSYIGSEIYYVTIFEQIKGNNKVLNNNLRFVDWENRGQKKNSGSPNILTMKCYNKIHDAAFHDNRFFARKFDYRYDDKIVKVMLEQTNSEIPHFLH